jgi:diguanylate cyclase (GGDEF)-like protein/PAS domain S-box-containing protein
MSADHPSVADPHGREAEMRGLSRFMIASRRYPVWQKCSFALRLAGCFVVITLAAGLVEILNHGEAGAYFIWIANGVLLAYLLLAPRRRWFAYLCIGFAAQIASTWIVRGSLHPLDLVYGGMNVSEVLIAALLLRRRSDQLPRFTSPGYLVRFIGYAVVAAPAVSGFIFMLITVFWLQKAPGHALLRWAAVDGMGTAVVTPACVAIFRTRFRDPAILGWKWLYLVLLAAVTITVFSQPTVPLLGLIYPLLILVLLNLGLGWASLATLCVATTAGWFSIRSMGPLAATYTATANAAPSVRLQVLVGSAMFMLYTVSIVLEKQRAIELQLRKIVAQHTLVTENSRDVIVLADSAGNINYVSPAMEALTGWKPEEVVDQRITDMVHADDLKIAEAAMAEMQSCTAGSRVECRLRTANGEPVWVEASLRVACDPDTGARSGILNIIRDIRERKQTEQQLQEAYRAVEALAVMDALTGLSNRRRFDQYLATEWRRAMRDRKPLSMLLIDADLFKSYNDCYGHLRGDSCLKQIAESALDVVTRPGDLVARFGGEEFAIILPDTRNQGAMQVATEVCDALRGRKLSHKSSPFGIATISVGCATIIPKLGQKATDLIEMADKALYSAKRAGRNQVCNSNAVEPIKDEAESRAVPGTGSGMTA